MGDTGSSLRLRDHPTKRSSERSASRTAEMFGELATFDPASPEYRRLQNRIIETCLPVADAIARRFGGRGEPLEDLRQAARLGLICAVKQFNPEIGAEFMAFARPTITGSIRRHFRDSTWPVGVPRSVKDMSTRLGQLGDGLTQKLGHHPTAADLAAELGVAASDVDQALAGGRAYRTVPWDTPLDSDGSPAGTGLGCADSSFEQIDDWETLRPLLIQLPERERRIVLLRYFGLRTQREIASVVGVSQMHVHRLLTKSLEFLRVQLELADEAAA